MNPFSIPPLEVPVRGPISGPIPRPIYLDPSCVLYMDFIDKISRGKAWDESPNGNHGVITGAVWKSNGLSFDGINDKAVASYDASMDVLDGNNPFTIFTGVKHGQGQLPGTTGVHQVSFSQENGTGTGRLFFMNHASNQGYATTNEYATYTGSATVGTNEVCVEDKWYLLALRYDGTTLEIWSNNVKGDTGAVTPDEGANGEYNIGVGKSGYYDFAGSINLLALFTRKFSDAEMTNMYEQWRGRL